MRLFLPFVSVNIREIIESLDIKLFLINIKLRKNSKKGKIVVLLIRLFQG